MIFRRSGEKIVPSFENMMCYGFHLYYTQLKKFLLPLIGNTFLLEKYDSYIKFKHKNNGIGMKLVPLMAQ